MEPAPEPLPAELVVDFPPGTPTRIWTGTVVVVGLEAPHWLPVDELPEPLLAWCRLWFFEVPVNVADDCEELWLADEVDPVAERPLEPEDATGEVPGETGGTDVGPNAATTGGVW